MKTIKKMLWLSLVSMLVIPSYGEVMLLKGHYYLEDVVIKKNVEDLIFFYHQQSLYVIPNSLITLVVGSPPLEGSSLAIDDLEIYIKENHPNFQTHPDVSMLLDKGAVMTSADIMEDSEHIRSWLNKANVSVTNTDAELEKKREDEEKNNELLITGSVGAGAFKMKEINEKIIRDNDYYQNVNLPLQNLIKYGLTHDLKISLRHKQTTQLGIEIEHLAVESKGGNAIHGEELYFVGRQLELFFKLMGAIDEGVYVGMGISMGKIYLSGEHIYNLGHNSKRIDTISGESFCFRLFASLDYDLTRYAGFSITGGYRGADVSTLVYDQKVDFSGMFIKSGIYIIIK